jgi:hypothetical protein
MLACIAQDEAGTVTCLEGERHNLEDGDFVRFTEAATVTLELILAITLILTPARPKR